MEEIVLKNAYRRLYKNVLLLNKQIDELDTELEETNRLMKESLLLDDKTLEEEKFHNVKKEVIAIEKELTTEILPIIRRSC